MGLDSAHFICIVKKTMVAFHRCARGRKRFAGVAVSGSESQRFSFPVKRPLLAIRRRPSHRHIARLSFPRGCAREPNRSRWQ